MKHRLLQLIIPLLLTLSVFAQTDTTLTPFNDSSYIKKSGYSLAPLPEFMIDPFIGLYLGIYATVFDYGDGKKYPNYYRSLTLSAAKGTKGKTNFGLDFINYGKYILSAKINYTRSTLFPFYGYNGYRTTYNSNFVDNTTSEYITDPFYNYDQQDSRLQMYIQDTIGHSFVNWKLGFDVAYYTTSRVDFDKLNKGVDEDDKAPDLSTLYDNYVTWGIIPDNEKNGGWANALTAAMVYDSRDRLTNPMHGIWADATLRLTPQFFGNYNNAVQISASFRQYITLIDEKISFVYRLRYDGNFGTIPFYTQSVLADGTNGIGGTETLWGILQNRVNTQQFAMANIEFRYKFLRFRFIKQNWHLAAVPLYHAGYLIKEQDMDLSLVSETDKAIYFKEDPKKLYHAIGFGVKIVMNENTVIGLDWARSLNEEAGPDAIYIGFAYSF